MALPLEHTFSNTAFIFGKMPFRNYRNTPSIDRKCHKTTLIYVLEPSIMGVGSRGLGCKTPAPTFGDLVGNFRFSDFCR